MKFIKCFALVLLMAFQLNAQQKTKTEFSRRPAPDPKIKNLKVGDRVPDILIPKIIRDTKTSAKMSDFNDQLLILDFFDTFCGSCIDALPKLDSLQKIFGNKIKILTVSYQSEEVMRNFFNTNKYLLSKKVQLPCAVEDKILGSHFQYKLISHEVWIYKGIVVAITGTDYVTAENIQTILDGKKVNWPVKNDMVDFDAKRPIFEQQETDQYNTKNGFLNYSALVGHRDGVDYKEGIKTTYDSVRNFYRTRFYNFDIVSTFRALSALSKTTPIEKNARSPVMLTPARLILNVNDKSKYVYDKSYGFRTDWDRENQICYEFVTAKFMEEKARLKYIIDDLSLKLGVTVGWEKRKMKCLVLVKTREISNLDSLNKVRNVELKDGWQIDMPGIQLMYFDLDGKYPPVFNDTGFTGQMIIGGDTRLEGLKKQLQQYGCDIIEEEREAYVFVITENDYKKPS